jgi:hypothetical protein
MANTQNTFIPRAKTFGDRLVQGIQGASEKGAELFGEHQKKKEADASQTRENEALKRLYDVNLSGVTDPKARQEIIGELAKTSGKSQFLDRLRGGGQSGNPPLPAGKSQPAKEAQQQGEQAPQDPNSPSGWYDQLSDSQRQEFAFTYPQEAKALEHDRQNRLTQQENARKTSPEFVRGQKITQAQADADVKYNTQLQETSKQHELKSQALNRLESLNNKGVTGKPYEKLLEKGGLTALTSDGRREFAADVKNLITDIRSILGSQFTGFEFQTILNAYPSADFSKGANAAIIKNLKEFQNIKEKEVEFAKQLKKDNRGKIPEDFQSKVNDLVHAYANTRVNSIKDNTQKIMNEEYGIPEGNVLMFAPDGEPINVPGDEVSKYLEIGANLP